MHDGRAAARNLRYYDAMKRIISCTVLVLLAGCVSEFDPLEIMPPGYQHVDSAALQTVFEEQSLVRIHRAQQGTSGMPPLERLASDEIDLAFTQNSNAFVSGVRAVLPAHRSVLHVLVREGLETDGTLVDMRGKQIYVANNSHAGRSIVHLAARRQHIKDTEYEIVDELVPGETDVLVYLGPLVAIDPPWYQPGYRFASLASRRGRENASNPDLVRYLLPNMYAVVIPATTYDIPGNEVDVPTLATDTLLVTRRDVPERVVYELTRTLLEQKPRFTAIAPQLFQGLNESFDPLDLNFPLHEGARRYLERDEPGVLERYAETINMLVYVTFLVLTGLLGLARWRARRKKDRIDTYYQTALAIRERAEGEDPDKLLEELRALEESAFEALIAERLAANESFRIFTDLLQRTRASIERNRAD